MAKVIEVEVPDLGGLDDVPVIEILVSPGDSVAANDALLTLESEKAAMDLPAPQSGVVRELQVSVGDTVSKGSIVLTMEVEDSAAAAPAAVPAPAAASAPAVKTEPMAAAAAPTAAPASTPVAVPASSNGGAAPGDAAGIYASPSVRRRSRELGIDLAGIAGTGRKGRITLDDLERDGVPVTSASAAPTADTNASGVEVREPLTRIQKASAKNLTNAWQTIPHVTQHEEADITELEAFRKQLNAEQANVKVTMVALLIKASAAALDAYPRFASTLDGDEVVLKPQRHIGFAADTPTGLVVPVIKDADRKGLLEIAGELMELSKKARDGKLGMADLGGAVFTISSLGGIGGTGFTPIVNPPQVAILGAVRSAMRPVWNGSDFEPRLMLPLSLSYDHRVIDGAAAARFCVHLKALLEDLRRAIL